MPNETLHHILQWSTLINFVILFIWFFFFRFAHGFMYRVHGRWFKLTEQQFDAIHYAGMAAFKILIIVFNLSPLLASYIIR